MGRLKPLVHIIVIFLCIGIVDSAAFDTNESAEIYNRAGALYREGKFSEAFDLYEQLIDEGIANPDLYYNAANAAYRNNMLGKSVLYLERALKLAPSDEDILTNLAFINAVKPDKEPVNTNPVVAFIAYRYNIININSAALWSGFSFAIAMLCATCALFLTVWKRTTIIIAAILSFTLFLVSTGILIEKVHHRSAVIEAVILAEDAHAYSGPGEDNTHIFTVHEGTKVEIQRHQDSWSLVRLKSGAGGWILSNVMEKI
ncbi:MAG: hypothetical protein JXB48_09065 [Candidatus Latescibacteria bacterium]|nr:hypothetical protein [Candidatus Latescibacterota bacterium]